MVLVKCCNMPCDHQGMLQDFTNTMLQSSAQDPDGGKDKDHNEPVHICPAQDRTRHRARLAQDFLGPNSFSGRLRHKTSAQDFVTRPPSQDLVTRPPRTRLPLVPPRIFLYTTVYSIIFFYQGNDELSTKGNTRHITSTCESMSRCNMQAHARNATATNECQSHWSFMKISPSHKESLSTPYAVPPPKRGRPPKVQ